MIHNGLHTNAQLLAAFRKAIGELDPSFTGVERFGETLTPVMDLWSLPEWALLRGEILYARAPIPVPAGGAGVFSAVELVNPAGSGILAVVTSLRNQSGVVGLFTGLDVGPALGAVGTDRGVPVDSRANALAEISSCTVVRGALAGTVSLPQERIAAAGGLAVSPYIISPGFKLFVIADTANLALTVTLTWLERPLLAQEGRA